MDLSVVIASCRNDQGLYLTVFSLLQQLSKSGLSYEIIIAADGGAETKWEKVSHVRCLRIRTGSPQGTRDAGIRAASAAYILVIEDHVIVFDIAALLEAHIANKGAISVPARAAEGPEMFQSYGYEMDWDDTFWNKRTVYTAKSDKPYRILGFGHACFILDRQWYLSSGGYDLEMQGWGGEEPQLNPLVYQTGRETWMIPHVYHAHFLTAGAHNGVSLSENYARNFCIAAYEHGGDTYLQKIQKHYNYTLQKTAAIEARRKLICQHKFGGDLDKMREFLKNEGIT